MPNTNQKVLEFESNINHDNGHSQKSMGKFFNRMEWIPEANYIIWNFGKKSPNEYEVCMSIYHENGEVIDFDGVFELPKEAITLLANNGIRYTYE